MIRRVAGVVAFAFALALLWPSWAAAATVPPYPAPPVTTGSDPVTAVVLAPSSTSGAAQAASASLPNTGAGFNTGLVIGVAAAVILIGALLVLFGTLTVRRARHH